jgi:hypothetical protein
MKKTTSLPPLISAKVDPREVYREKEVYGKVKMKIDTVELKPKNSSTGAEQREISTANLIHETESIQT